MKRYIYFGEATVAATGEACMFSVDTFLGMTPASASTVTMHFNSRNGAATDDVVTALAGFGLTEVQATALIEVHGTGNSVISGLLGLLPILATLAGVLLVTFKENVKKYFLYGSFGLVFVSVLTIWFTAPSKLNGVESMYNSLVPTLGTLMKEGTTFTMGLGFFVAIVGSLYGITALVLNKLGKIAE